ncbi:hypothetical protein IW146_006783 [Coemansia sp. RSA 922]|nr:hypothetical protein H4S03_001577 [Coemansia sp. S3946]KAJ2043763.1 hypothetical protein GGI08_007309 [Coemansia sp. S2]KAJ2049423.1 hypothetical protein H4S04_003233 [Coemansia sp. S16]KAJ2108547.1 hypothetical protein IW146_006783 [Coemansia sp. RSA 922]KAJ2348952.1 hypothetical protein GGH92_002671 [Coemansia sp. RSA 2673]
MDRNDPTISEKLLGSNSSEDIAEQTSPSKLSSAPRSHPTRQEQRRRSPVEIAVKVVFGAIFLFLLALICTYAGSKTIFDTTRKDAAEPGEKVLVEPKIRDCRSTGCFSEFECVPVAADFACFIPPCPSTVYECQPKASLKDPEDALFSILPVSAAPSQSEEAYSFNTDRYGKPTQLTEGYFACIQQHNGQSSWRHPTEPCNTCRCNARGGVSCTKMLCKPGSRLESVKEATTSYPSRLLTTIMSQISAEAGAGVSSATPRFTSIVIDIQQ